LYGEAERKQMEDIVSLLGPKSVALKNLGDWELRT
jgi:hypothetical protein